MSEKNIGKISQIIGVVIDVEFSENLPALFNALTVEMPGGKKLVLEVQQHLGGNMVRTVAMSTTDGLTRGQEVTDTGEPIVRERQLLVLGHLHRDRLEVR